MAGENKYIECGSCFDDFDGDLLNLVPGVEKIPEFRQSRNIHLFTYGSTDRSGTMLAHPATWNGLGALFFTRLPLFARDRNGWVSLKGYVTTNPLIRVSAADVIRDAWVHNYRAMLDMEFIWFTPFDGMMDLLNFHRGLKAPWLTARVKQAQESAAIDWVVEAASRAIQAVTNERHDHENLHD